MVWWCAPMERNLFKIQKNSSIPFNEKVLIKLGIFNIVITYNRLSYISSSNPSTHSDGAFSKNYHVERVLLHSCADKCDIQR